MGTERMRSSSSSSSKAAAAPLQNFTMPRELRWGTQRHLRCMKLDSDDDAARISPRRRRGGSRGADPAADDDGDGEGIAAVREKVMLDLQTAADRMKDAIFNLEVSGAAEPPTTAAERPWNLRTRRAACKTPAVDPPGIEAAAVAEKSSRLRSGAAAAAGGERRRFAVALSRSEIEDDFAAIVGHRPPRRPKKRARVVQKQLDTLFPGLWLTEVTPDMYKVAEAAP